MINMQKILSLAAALVIGFTSSAQVDRSVVPSAGPAPKIQIKESQNFTLDNGLKVIVVENHKIPKVSFQLSLDYDPVMEGDKAGMIDLTGQILKTGTTTKSKADIDEAIDFIGASISTSGNGMYGTSLKKYSADLLALMTDILYNPSFKEEEFDKIRKQTLSGLASQKEDANSIASNVSKVLNFGKDHPYGEVVTETTVNNITLEDCKAYYNTYFKPNTAYLVVVGDINLAEAKKLVNQAFGTWAKGDVPTAEYPIKDAPSKNHVAFVNKTGAVQSVVQITFPFDLTPGHEDEIKVRVMNNILGGGVFLGRLMQNLREEHAYTYGARSSLNSDKLRGSFTAYASVRNDVTDSSVVEFLYELDRMVNEDVSAEDLQMVKNSLSGSFGRSLESPQTVARFALNMDRYKLPADYYKEYLTQVESVTIEDVREMARKYLRPEAANILVVGNQMEVAEKLARFDANGKVNHYDLEGNTISGILRKDAPEGVTPQTIADNYILAITNSSDMKKAMKILKKVKDIKQVGEVAVAGMDGMSLDFTVYKKAPNKYSMSIMFNGMVAQKQVFDGTKGKSVNMQTGSKDLAGEELETVKASAVMFGERNFATSENTMEVVGVETVEGADCYVLDITNKAGSTSSHYYDAKTGLKVQTVSTQEVPGAGEVTQITKLSDYKTVNKVKFPHLMSIDGPQKISMKTTALEVNSKVSDAVFQ